MRKRAIIICREDAFANAVKPTQLRTFLEHKGYAVETYATEYMARLRSRGVGRLLPGRSALHVKVFLLEGLRRLAVGTRSSLVLRAVTSRTELTLRRLRGALVSRVLGGGAYDLAICESNYDVGFTTESRIARSQVLDLPCPLAEELFYGGSLSRSSFERLRDFEAETYGKADFVAFHWHTYASFVQATKYAGANYLPSGYGTVPKLPRARYSTSPRLVFLGNLAGYWANLPLLERLTAVFPDIDVYGGPPPPADLRINYKGYAPTLDLLANYQFGLVTLTQDELRKHSFSSKQLEYFSYGLPVLAPAWRPDPTLAAGSVPYTEESFLSALQAASQEHAWANLSSSALLIAQEHSWDRVLEKFFLAMELSAR